MNGNNFAPGQNLEKPIEEIVNGWILAGWASKSPEPCPTPVPCLSAGCHSGGARARLPGMYCGRTSQAFCLWPVACQRCTPDVHSRPVPPPLCCYFFSIWFSTNWFQMGVLLFGFFLFFFLGIFLMEKISHSKVGGDNTVTLVVEHCVCTCELLYWWSVACFFIY